MLALKPSVMARLPSRPAMPLQKLTARSSPIVELSTSAAFRNLNISVRRSMQTLASSTSHRTRPLSLFSAPNHSVFNFAFQSVLKDPTVQTALGVAARSVFTTSKRRMYALEKDADQHPRDVNKQLALLRELVKENPHRVTARLESRRYAVDDAIFLEYMKALAKANRFQHHRDMNELRRRITPVDSGMDYSAQYGSSDPQAQQQQQSYAAYPSSGYPTSQSPADYSGYYYPQGQPYGYPPQYGQPDPYVYNQPIQQQQNQRKDDDDDDDSSKRKLGFMGYMSQMAGRLLSMVVYIVLFLTITSAFLYYFGGGKSGMGSLGPLTDSKVKEIVPQNANVRFTDVKGCDEAKEELKEVVEFLKNPAKFTRLGGQLPKGILMTGPPGTGKTLLAKAVAGEAGVPFFYSSGSEFEEMYVGVGARRVRDLFTAAKRKAPCLIFIDEIDAVGGTRRLKEQQAMRMTLNQLLVELDGFSDSKGIIVIGATNFPELLDKALVRPGRFDRHIAVPLPDVKGRKEILDLYLQKVPKATDVNTLVLARGTPGCSGADLFNLVNSAAVQASVKNENAVTMGHLEWAKDKILMGAERKSAVMTEQVKKLTAYHEGGHALVALNTSGAHPIHKATIMPRGRALGMVHQLPEHDVVSVSKAQLLAQLDVCMGGRVAEELIFGPDNVTTGASSDLSKATNIARGMVIEYGMSEKVGPLRIAEKDLDKLSPDTRKVIDEEVRQIVDASYARAKKLLTDKETDLHLLAKALLKYETLSSDEIRTVLANKPLDRSITN